MKQKVKKHLGSGREMERIRYGISPTMRCNWACKMCNRFLDKFPWPDPDLTVDEILEAGKMVELAGITINRIRVTGGEPTLHSDLPGVCDAILKSWKPERVIVVLTNGSNRIKEDGLPRVRWKRETSLSLKIHKPWTISPADLGLSGEHGTRWVCETQNGCGRGFDVHGFSGCVVIGAMGRMLGIDPYSREPSLWGHPDVCKHCLFSLSRKTRWGIWRDVANGALKFPTQTWAAAEQRGPMPLKMWRDR